jgi:hypothetical protein
VQKQRNFFFSSTEKSARISHKFLQMSAYQEVLYHKGVFFKSIHVLSRFLQLIEIVVVRATDDREELLGRDEVDHVPLDDAPEALFEGSELLFDRLVEVPVDVQVDVLLSVRVRQRDLFSAFLEKSIVMSDYLERSRQLGPEALVLRLKILAVDLLHVSVENQELVKASAKIWVELAKVG